MLNPLTWLSQALQPKLPAKRWRRKYTKAEKLYAIRGATAQARRRLELERVISDQKDLIDEAMSVLVVRNGELALDIRNLREIREKQAALRRQPVNGVQP